MNKFVTADLHLDHEYAIKFRSKHFNSIDDMNKTIVNNWNKTISNEDVTYILGDIYLDGAKKTPEKYSKLMNLLNGKKILILGNHDNKNAAIESNAFEYICRLEELKYKKHYITMCHYPLEAWNSSQHTKSIMIYGHTHEENPIRDGRKRFCASQDSNMFYPILLSDVIKMLKTNTETVDHHGDLKNGKQ